MKTILREKLPNLREEQRLLLAQYYELLIEGNTRVNLTAIVEPDEVADKHFVDSLLVLPYIPVGARCIDVGTGAGLPGIPLCIARPDISMTLLDSLHKRVDFLREAVEALGITAECVHMRAEDAGRENARRGAYDVALSRAVAPLPVLLELLLPFVHMGGLALCYKGKAAAEEMQRAQNAARILGCTLELLPITATYGERAFIRAHKTAPTPLNYPRQAGTPAKKPL